MASLFGGTPKVIPEFTGLQVNTSVQVLPIPIIYGAPRISLNLIYYNGFQVKQVSQGGKGILSGGKGAKQTEYFATILMALGEGPVSDVLVIYQDSDVFTPADYPTNGTAFFQGGAGQTPWSVIESQWPTDARPYPFVSYYGFNNAQLDSSATVPQIDLVVNGILSGSSPLNNSTISITTGQYDNKGNPLSFIRNINLGTGDADPAHVIYDFLTNPTYGAGFPQEWIDAPSLFTSFNGITPKGDAAVETFCQAVGLAWSVVINNAETASSIIERWTKNLNVAPVWNGQTLQFIPYWDSYAAGNPGYDPANGQPLKYYQPITAPIIAITMDYILQAESKDEDPITFNRKDPMDVYNTVRIDFKDRFNFYNDNASEAKDEAHVELFGPRVDNIGLANEFSLASYAAQSALMQLRRNIGVVNTYTWRMSPLWAWLNPMDIVSIPDPVNYSSTITVRITSVEDDDNENVTVTAEQFLPASAIVQSGGAQSPTSLPTSPTTPPNQGALNSPAPPVYPPVIVEPNTTLQTALGFSTPQFFIGLSGGLNGFLDPNYGGAFVWLSLDAVNYSEVGNLTGVSTIGYLTNGLGSYGGANPDTSDVLTVTLSESDGALNSFSDGAAQAGASACFVVDINGYELLTYTTATLVAPFTYALTGLYRGLFGSLPRAFSAGAQFMFAGNGSVFFDGNLPSAYIGKNFFVKFQTYNPFFGGVEDLADCVVYEYFVAGAGGNFLVSDTVSSSDVYLLGGQYAATLADGAVATESYTQSISFNASLSESTLSSSDVYTP